MHKKYSFMNNLVNIQRTQTMIWVIELLNFCHEVFSDYIYFGFKLKEYYELKNRRKSPRGLQLENIII